MNPAVVGLETLEGFSWFLWFCLGGLFFVPFFSSAVSFFPWHRYHGSGLLASSRNQDLELSFSDMLRPAPHFTSKQNFLCSNLRGAFLVSFSFASQTPFCFVSCSPALSGQGGPGEKQSFLYTMNHLFGFNKRRRRQD